MAKELKIKSDLTDKQKDYLAFLEETRKPKLVLADWWSDLLSAGLAEYVDSEIDDVAAEMPAHIIRRVRK